MFRALVGALLVSAVAAGLWWTARPRLPEPLQIEQLGEMDPEVASLLRDLRDAVSDNRSDPDAWGRFAMACEANGFVGAARDGYRVAARLAPDEPRWIYRLALVSARLGEHEAALEALTRVNELAPEYAPAWCRRGAWMLDRANTAAAEDAFRRALSVSADDPFASIGLARVHLQRREPARAAAILERVLERQPGERYALQLLGTAYRRMGRVDDATFALAVGAGGEPSANDPWSAEVGEYRRGFATLLKSATAEAMAGRLDRALPMLEELRRRNPDDVALANHTAEVLVSAGRARDAIQLLTALPRERANVETELALASAYLVAGDLDRAGALADGAMERAPGARAWAMKGMVAWRRGDRRAALAAFDQALARDPRDLRVMAWIGFIHLDEGRTSDAAARFAEVLRRDPLQPDALAGLATARYAAGDRAEAKLALTRAEQVAPDHPRVREARARIGGSAGGEAKR